VDSFAASPIRGAASRRGGKLLFLGSTSGMSMTIDIAFDFRSDAGGKDPDVYSPTLRAYHKLLWSKSLPSGHLSTSRI
jgi:hypothetical protein